MAPACGPNLRRLDSELSDPGYLHSDAATRMLLTLSTTRSPATDLGYLLHKNPARVQSFDLSFGKAHVFYPEADECRCTAALLLDVDPVWLVRGRKGPAGEAGTLDQYVNDRPYVASSLMSVALAQVFGTALAGRRSGSACPVLARRQQGLDRGVCWHPGQSQGHPEAPGCPRGLRHRAVRRRDHPVQKGQ